MDHEEELRRLQEQLKRTEEGWQADTVMWRARQTELDGRMEELRDCLAGADSSGKQVVHALSRRIKATDTLLGYLRSKARIMVIPQYAFASCGIKNEEGVGLVDKRGTPMSHWGDNLDLQLLERHVGLLKPDNTEDSDMPHGLLDQGDGEYVERIASAVMQITEVMELLVKRAIVAESVLGAEKQKSQTSQQEIQEKCAQIEKMWARVEEMERVALGTTGALKDMQLKLEDMELETSKQRIRAADNERELSRVKHDFGILRSSVDNLVKARDRIRSMETRIQDVEKVSERFLPFCPSVFWENIFHFSYVSARTKQFYCFAVLLHVCLASKLANDGRTLKLPG